MKAKHSKIISAIALVIAAVGLVGCGEQWCREHHPCPKDSTDLEFQHLINPDFTDLGVGSLISNGRYRLSESSFKTNIYDKIAYLVNNPTTPFLAATPDVCLPPLHGGWSTGLPTAAVPWIVQPNLQLAFANTASSVKDSLMKYIDSVWSVSRPVPPPALPLNVVCEITGLNAPLVTTDPVGQFTTATIQVYPSGSMNPTLVRITLTYDAY